MDENIKDARGLPFSLTAEQSVLGSVLIEPERFSEIATIIKASDFYLEEHESIYLAMQDLFLKNRKIDVVTLIDTLVERGIYSSKEQSAQYVMLIAKIVPSAQNIKDYATIVKNKSILRKLIDAAEDISESAYKEKGNVNDLIESAERKIFAIAEGQEQKGFEHIKDVLLSTYEHLKLISTDKEAAKGTPTGFSSIDKVLVGMGKGDLVLIGARPGMGKTSFAMNIATNVARSTGKAVCVFSLEMSAQQLVSRMLSSEALIDSYALRSGNLSDEDWSKLAHASSSLSECDIFIDDTSGITVTGMKAKLRRIKNLGLVVIDYLQLMQSDRRIDNRVNEVAEISRGLKLLAKELGVPVITCAQLSRGPESRTDRTPQLSDLRDSGAIEQDADVVMFIYREEYYDKKQENENLAKVVISKNRHGSTDKIDMNFIGKYTKFTSIESDMEEPGA